ncbi:hypothetical protein ONZ43_g4283 [Nemania bipapillata]|uniref:Uncharacterized protein n=1 Tax=Nemania bipapillata TaxID=110536 RepID=A0ACC2IPT6_9PEZI|nr:hypothetical protein ONZ43_g4283 [Nemania bipapillata]
MRFSRTDMVRCKSLADETRMLVAMVMSGEVDVVDDVNDETIIQRPARARTEAPRGSVGAPSPALHGLEGVETVKVEEMSDEDHLDFSSVDEGFATPTKRKAEEIPEDITMTDEADADAVKPKRVKVEDDGAASDDFGGIMLARTGSHSPLAKDPVNNKQERFHWALEEDDDDSDEDVLNNSDPAIEVTNITAVGGIVPLPSQPPDSNGIREDAPIMDGIDAAGGGDALRQFEEEDVDDDEDEELHMNVGKVYEKTLVQLGQSLGESIIDDD